MPSKIRSVKALQVLDSRGNPTVGAKVELYDGAVGEAIVPSGASTGIHEALELRDGDERFFSGKGVQRAINNVNIIIAPEVLDRLPNFWEIDELMIKLDGTEKKEKLGANAILAVSMAVTRAAAAAENMPLYRYLRMTSYLSLGRHFFMPVPQMNILNGGQHADNNVDLQEFMVMPVGFKNFPEALQAGVEIYHSLKKLLKAKGLSTSVGDEGGFAPDLRSNEEALQVIAASMKDLYSLGNSIVLALDPAASTFYSSEGENYRVDGELKSNEGMIEYYGRLAQKYHIKSIEDGLAEEDWGGFKLMTENLGDKMQIVGDDLYVTNKKLLKKGIDEKASNSILIKLNQIGTVSETLETIKAAHEAGFTTVVSHRSGETEDTFIADLAVAVNAGQIKTGAPCRTDRTAKYNRLLWINEKLGGKAQYPGINCFTSIG
ncbi:phosphopyruvate hydratase [Patescibacteria group bacterium]